MGESLVGLLSSSAAKFAAGFYYGDDGRVVLDSNCNITSDNSKKFNLGFKPDLVILTRDAVSTSPAVKIIQNREGLNGLSNPSGLYTVNELNDWVIKIKTTSATYNHYQICRIVEDGFRVASILYNNKVQITANDPNILYSYIAIKF